MDNEKNKNFALRDLLNFNANFTAQAPSKHDVQSVYNTYYFICNCYWRQLLFRPHHHNCSSGNEN